MAGRAVRYVDPNNIDDIANGIGEVFFSPDLQKDLVKKGLEQGKKFSIEKMMNNMIQVYEQYKS